MVVIVLGNICVNMEELKIKDYREYRGWYCGLCSQLKDKAGLGARFALSYDMTFLYMLLGSLYDMPVDRRMKKCPVHPFLKHLSCYVQPGEYVADMALLLSYYDFRDSWKDEKKLGSLLLSEGLKRQVWQAGRRYPKKLWAVKRYIKRLSAFEQKMQLQGQRTGSASLSEIDQAAGYTGELLSEIFVWRRDLWEEPLRRMGFYLGKFIYLMDAWKDIEQDQKTGNYNPFAALYQSQEKDAFDAFIISVLEKMAAECCRAFELLPLVDNVEILRNILYSGIWAQNGKGVCAHEGFHMPVDQKGQQD